MRTKNTLLAAAIALPIVCSSASAQVCGNGVFLDQLSANPFLADSTANKFGAFGSPYSPRSCAAMTIENSRMKLHGLIKKAEMPLIFPASPQLTISRA